jgi:lysophospholipase L1-like esterase
MKTWCVFHLGLGLLRPDLDPNAVFLTVRDAQGTYTIPYLQSAPQFEVTVEFREASLAKVRLVLSREGRQAASKTISPKHPQASLGPLAPGEYVLDARGFDGAGQEILHSRFTRLGIGTVIAALGDSITEGYFGHGFRRGPDLVAKDFPPEAVSRDGRNFPQYSPTTATHLPEVNCFQSWMTDLNNLLSDSWRHPVFIANEGWGGTTTAAYLELMRQDTNWQERLRLLRPQVWLIHLGVNDERGQVPAEVFERNLEAIVRTLIDTYGAAPNHVLVAKPSYDYFEGAEPILVSYCERIDGLVKRLGLSPGPDFFAAYATEKQRWYGDDPVHPNVDGVRRMAELWHEAILKAIPSA